MVVTEPWPNNVPTPFTSFVGRTVERRQAIDALAGSRLLVLTGAGGTGKTRLALEVANASAASFRDGGWWVDLAPTVDGGHVGAALANVLGVRPLPGRTHTQAAVMNLAAGRALVVLDSREHVAEGAADLCEALLRGCPNVTVLATSRTRLRVPGESDWPVPPLALPSTDAPEEIARSDAGALFVERALRVHFRFTLDGGNGGRPICGAAPGGPPGRSRRLLREATTNHADPLQESTDGLDFVTDFPHTSTCCPGKTPGY